MEIDLGKITLGVIIAIFIGIIFVMALLPTIADEIGIMTTKSTITNESVSLIPAWNPDGGGVNNSVTFTVANYPSGWKTTGCPITNFALANDSEYFADTTDYVVTASTGTFVVNPTAEMNKSGNDTVVTYTHCRDGYTKGSTSAIMNMILIFAGIAVIGFVMFNIFKK